VPLCSSGFLDDIKLASGPVSQQADTKVAIANSLYFCAFEKADEALLNDYEEMIAQVRTNKEGVVTLFQSMIEGVIAGNPVSIDAAIEKRWNELPVDLRAVPDTPIPLNEEQQKVLQAIHHEEGRIIVVEGPPGTGKSHTIVAIAADCAFRKKSCLVLSDKAEALEVVYDKLSRAMNEVRGSEDFPNPLLRLGRDITPAFGYGAPHSSARGTSTPLNNALLSAPYGPLRHPKTPGASLTGLRLLDPSNTPWGFPCCVRFPCVHAVATTPAQRLAASSARFPSRISLPRSEFRVGLRIDLFEACSAFTRVTACTLAPSPYFVTVSPKASTISLPP
jgi:AAA domain